MEEREVGIEDRKQDNEEKGEKKVMAIEIDIHMGFSIRPPPNGLTTAEDHIPAEWFRWLLASIPYYSFIFFRSDHFSPLDACLQNRFQHI
jgi:hypothetical protein